MNPFDSRFVQNLRTRIAEDLTRLHTELGNGSQINANDAAVTAMRCVMHMGRIDGLEAALNHIEQVNDEMSGKSKKDKD